LNINKKYTIYNNYYWLFGISQNYQIALKWNFRARVDSACKAEYNGWRQMVGII